MLHSPSHWVRSSQGKWIPRSQISWDQNKKALSQIHCNTFNDQALISFLERRWLAKATGFYPFEVNYGLPCFDISCQVSPETKNSYARDPFSQTSKVYENRMEAWKKSLPSHTTTHLYSQGRIFASLLYK